MAKQSQLSVLVWVCICVPLWLRQRCRDGRRTDVPEELRDSTLQGPKPCLLLVLLPAPSAHYLFSVWLSVHTLKAHQMSLHETFIGVVNRIEGCMYKSVLSAPGNMQRYKSMSMHEKYDCLSWWKGIQKPRPRCINVSRNLDEKKGIGREKYSYKKKICIKSISPAN